MTAAFVLARRPGRPPCCPDELVRRIIRLHQQGLSYRAISDVLNREGIPTPAGSAHRQKSHVDRLLHTRYASDITKEVEKDSWEHRRLAGGPLRKSR